MVDAQAQSQLMRTLFVIGLGVVTICTCDPRFVLHKCLLFLLGLAHLILSRDRKWSKRKLPDPDEIKHCKDCRKIRLIFIRHGESEWNEVFNKGKIKIFPRFIRALFRELGLFFTGDSIFIDSPLNEEGLSQVHALRQYLRAPAPPSAPPVVRSAIAVLRGEHGAPSSVVVASNLRRAIATATIGLWDRLRRNKERVKIMTECQEMSRNIDTLALAPPKSVPDLSGNCGSLPGWRVDTSYETKHNSGNKALFGTNGLKRMKAFNAWAFDQLDEPNGVSTIVIGGHSLWFRTFFQTFLPKSSAHSAKKKKMVNCGVISFNLTTAQAASGAVVYRIAEESICVVYGGFEK